MLWLISNQTVLFQVWTITGVFTMINKGQVISKTDKFLCVTSHEWGALTVMTRWNKEALAWCQLECWVNLTRGSCCGYFLVEMNGPERHCELNPWYRHVCITARNRHEDFPLCHRINDKLQMCNFQVSAMTNCSYLGWKVRCHWLRLTCMTSLTFEAFPFPLF